jgi:methionyl-tRNA synthetase
MVHRYFDGERPADWAPESFQDPAAREAFEALVAAAAEASREVPAAFEEIRLKDALDAAWGPVVRANEFIERVKPWVVAKDPARRAELGTAMGALLETLRLAAIWAWPAIPGKSEELWSQLALAGRPGEIRGEEATPRYGIPPAGEPRVGEVKILFPKIELRDGSSTKASA